MSVKRLNHAVLYVRDAEASAAFYSDLLDFEIVEQMPGAVFLRLRGGDNHHDLGLFSVGARRQPDGGGASIGLYHLAWEVDRIQDLTSLRAKLIASGAFVGESDHGASLSLYGRDPDGLEFEIFWPVPKEEWDSRGFGTRKLKLDEEIERRKSA